MKGGILNDISRLAHEADLALARRGCPSARLTMLVRDLLYEASADERRDLAVDGSLFLLSEFLRAVDDVTVAAVRRGDRLKPPQRAALRRAIGSMAEPVGRWLALCGALEELRE